MKNNLIHLLFIFILFGCTDELVSLAPNSGITGKWNWSSTDGGLAAHIHETPETTGKSIQLILNGDLTYKVLENNEKVSSGKYKLTKVESIYSGESGDYITIGDNLQIANVVLEGIIRITEGNILTISDNVYDGIRSSFIKEN